MAWLPVPRFLRGGQRRLGSIYHSRPVRRAWGLRVFVREEPARWRREIVVDVRGEPGRWRRVDAAVVHGGQARCRSIRVHHVDVGGRIGVTL